MECTQLVSLFACLADETRLRILHLLARGPLCVCHLQKVLGSSQVRVSKHLACLKKRGILSSRRHANWMIYHLANPLPPGVDGQIEFLRKQTRSNRVFAKDLKRLEALRCECDWITRLTPSKTT